MKQWEESLLPVYGTPTIELVRGKGSILIDRSGKRYLDFLGGIATSVLGHAHPEIVKAVRKQVGELGHVSNFYAHPNVLSLAERLIQLTGDESARVFFCNSGAEANEAALKLSRKTGRTRIVATEGSFHGRTMGALSLTGQPAKRDPFTPLLPGIRHIPFGDISALDRAITRKVAMVILEPIQGENGVIVPPAGYLAAAREICDATGTLLVFDCVQTGMGRTGEWFGFEHEGVLPDAFTLAKGLGGGLPLGALITRGIASKLFQPGDHGTTFGGNPIATAAGLAAISVIQRQRLMKNAMNQGARISKALEKSVKEVRGQGLLIGIELHRPYAKELVKELGARGILVNAPNPHTIRIAPALNISTVQVTTFIKVFLSALKEVDHG